MTLDPLLFNTYKQYKAGTNRVMAWLASKAQETSVLSDLFPKPETKAKGRLKGKARAAAKEAPQKHIVPLAFINRIAKSIASIANVKVPENILLTLQEVIAARTACNLSFEQQRPTDTSTKASNQNHKYFIEVLRETLQILKPLSQASNHTNGAKDIEANTEIEKDIANLNNRFNYLEVEETTEDISSSLPTKSKKAAAKFEVQLELELEPTDEDISFAIFCLFKDLTDIRHYVRQTWAEYREHQLTFTTAAVTMNTAISIFRRLNEEFLADFPQFKDHGAIIEYLYNDYCDPNSEDEQDFATYTGPNFKISTKILFCDNTYAFLRLFFMGAELPFYQDGHRLELRLTDDEETLLRCLSLLGMLVAVAEDGGMYDDQLILGLKMLKDKTMNPDKHIYTWVVLAVQLFIDTRRVVGNDGLTKCLHEAQELHKWMSASLEQSMHFGSANSINDYYKVNTDLPKIKTKLDATLEEDFVQSILDDMFDGDASRYSWGPYYLVRNHPMLLGLAAQFFMIKLHEIGIAVSSDQGAVMTSIHLYNAAVQQLSVVPMSLEWPDMEKLISWQSSPWIFVGDRPKMSLDCFTHYQLAMGTSAIFMSKNRHGITTARPSKLNGKVFAPMSQKKGRKLKLMSTYIDLMNDPAKAAPVKQGGRRWVPTRAADEPFVMLEMMVTRYLERNAAGSAELSTIEKKNSSTRLKIHPLNMLSILKDSLKSDEQIFRFDLLTLNQRCVELLQKVQKVCVEKSPLDYPAHEYAKGHHIISIFSHMMSMELSLHNHQSSRFPEACLLVKDITTKAGNEECSKSKALCFIEGDGNKVVTDSFKTPVEDTLLLRDRTFFGRVFIDDGENGLTII